jgi:hypothetical protein
MINTRTTLIAQEGGFREWVDGWFEGFWVDLILTRGSKEIIIMKQQKTILCEYMGPTSFLHIYILLIIQCKHTYMHIYI